MSDNSPSVEDWLGLLAEPALVVTAAGRIVAANRAFLRLVGGTVTGQSLADLVTPAENDLAEKLRLWARNKQPVTAALRLQTDTGAFDAGVHAGRLSGPCPDGQTALLLLRLTQQKKLTEPFRTLTEQVDALTREISARRRAEQQLLALKASLEERVADRTAQLRQLTSRLIEAEEAERRRLAHALHDNLQQLLVTASLQSDVLESLTDEAPVLEVAEKLRELLQEAIAASRSLTLELSPPILHDAGLGAALEWLGRRAREQYGLHVHVHVSEQAEPEDEQTRIALFMAARELLFNITKHAGAEVARLSLRPADPSLVVLRVQDEGRGFDLEAVGGRAQGDGFGLYSLRERAEFFGGEMRIETAPGQGTTVEIAVPRGAQRRADASTATLHSRRSGAGGTPRIKVLLAADRTLLREALAVMLAGQVDIELIGEADDGQQAVELTHRHQPDVVVMGTTMPRLSGVAATRRIRAEAPEVAVVGLSMHDPPEVVREMMSAGASSMVHIEGRSPKLLEAVRQAVRQG